VRSSRYITALQYLLVLYVFFYCAAASGQQPQKAIENIQDLELGMPRDYVLAKLAAIYKLEKKDDFKPPTEMWDVSSGDRYIGELTFKNGLLDSAEVRLYAGQNANDLSARLFTAIYENSGKSIIKEEDGDLTRSRSAVADNRKNFLPPLLFNSSGTQSIPNSFFELHDLSKVPLNRDYEAQPDGRTRVNMNSVYGSTRIGPSSR